jgi:hypothetical protein
MAVLGLQLGARMAALLAQVQADLTALQAVIAAGSDPRPALDVLAGDAQAVVLLCRTASSAHGQGMIG